MECCGGYWSLKQKILEKTLGPAIAGWVSFIIGLLVLNLKDLEVLSFLTARFVLYTSVTVLIILVYIYAYASKISNRKGLFGKVGFYLTRTGWFVGFVIGLICAIIK
jgi:hypothetical protein